MENAAPNLASPVAELISDAQPALVPAESPVEISETPLYDATAEQTVPLQTTFRGRTFRVAHIFGPLSNEVLKDNDRRRDVRLSGSKKGVKTQANNFAASVALWNELIVRVEGFGPPNTPPPPDWKSRIADLDKADVIDSALLACEIVDAPPAEEGGFLPWDYQESESTYYLRALFSGHVLLLEHVLKTASANQISEFKGLMGSAEFVQGKQFGRSETRLPPRAARLATLYDQLKVSTKGYAEPKQGSKGELIDSIPLHHKVAVVLSHISTEQEPLTGK